MSWRNLLSLCSFLSLAMVSIAHAEAAWVQETWRGCKVWSETRDKDQTVSWGGECVGGYISGEGELRTFFKGQILHSVRGVAVRGRLQGKARVQHSDGTVSEIDYGQTKPVAPSGREWSYAKDSGCKVWNPAPEPKETVSWSGDCKDGFADGYGEAAWFEDGHPGNVVRGNAVKGRMKGKVQVRYQTGDVYVGPLDAAGNRSGSGTFTESSGAKYVGKFLAGNFHGRGKVTSPDGREIVADWKNGVVEKLVSDNLPKPFEKECVDYGFNKGTSAFSECRMRLAEAQQQLAMMTRQYELQQQMYQQQVAAYNAQQEAIRKERERQRSEALLRLGLGMMNSQSPTFAGGLSDGVAAMYGLPPKPPAALLPPPNIGNYTVRLPNGNQVYCNYVNNYMSCR